jgi:AraC-like DNA-binding protein
MSTITFSVFPPALALHRDIECIRLAVHAGTAALTTKICPNGLPGIVFQMGPEGSAISSISTRSARVENVPILFMHGLGAEPSVMQFMAGPFSTIQIAFKPHALYSVFHIDSSTLRDGFWLPHEFGGDHLTKQLVLARSAGERITILSEFLITQLAQSVRRDELVEASLASIHECIDTISVHELAERFNISQRQFEKRFSRVVGMPPKLYIRIKRVNEALHLISTGRYERLSDIAYALNYYDQSHFVHEIRAFSWVTPTSIAQKVGEFRQDQTGASYL